MPSPSPQSRFDQQPLGFVCDGLYIEGILHRPAADNPPVVIGSHGLFSNGDSPKQAALAEALNAAGIAFLRIDHRGCGRSEGVFEVVTTIEGRVHDLIAAAEALREHLQPPLRLGLFGSSLGGTTCLAASGALSPLRMVTLAAPVDSRSLLAAARRNPANPLPPLFESEAFQFDLADKLDRVHDLLVIHGEADEVVPVAHARRIHAASGAPKQLLINPGGDHRVTDPAHQRLFIESSRNWFQYLSTVSRSNPSSC